MADEQTEVERLKDEKARIDRELAAAKLLADQRENLLPKLKAKKAALKAKIALLDAPLLYVNRAIDSIEHGTPTDYHLRKPRVPKTAEGA